MQDKKQDKNQDQKHVNKRPSKELKYATALQYDPEKDSAPKVIATGKGIVAEKIIEKAKETDIPVYQDTNLSKTLSALGIGDQIPPEIYEVVAEILVFIGSVDKSYGEEHKLKYEGYSLNK